MFRRRKEIVCQELVELITDYLEGALPRLQRRSFEAHIEGCEDCTEYLAQMRETILISGRLQADDLTPAMRKEFSVLYERWRLETG
jgi:anti-sigma factor RsiW